MSYKFVLKLFFHALLAILLTIVSQIGGIIYLISVFIISNNKKKYLIKRFIVFFGLYLLSVFFIIPNIAPYFGRVKINDNYRIKSHNYFTKLCNRDYVTTELHSVLTDISLRLNKELPNIKLIYLDANFPFINGFPLLPHLSHNDGKKIDISFIYENKLRKTTNSKPSNSGYGVYVEPLKDEFNQNRFCKQKGYWQYDFTKYFTFGSTIQELHLSNKATKILIEIILKNDKVSKLFIEPHLKNRLNIYYSKVRYHGCKAVRHDDHIHLQIR